MRIVLHPIGCVGDADQIEQFDDFVDSVVCLRRAEEVTQCAGNRQPSTGEVGASGGPSAVMKPNDSPGHRDSERMAT